VALPHFREQKEITKSPENAKSAKIVKIIKIKDQPHDNLVLMTQINADSAAKFGA